MKHKVTPWFEPKMKPKHVGIYETETWLAGLWWAYWDGTRWGCARRSQIRAELQPDFTNADQQKPWRGLMEKPQ